MTEKWNTHMFLTDDNDPLIKQWAKLYAESADKSGNFEVKTITDKAFIKSRSHEIYDILQQSYANKGGFKGASSPKGVYKNTDLAKFVFDSEGNILALSLYRIDLGGRKRFGSGANISHPDYKDAVKAIVKSDIEPYDNWYWVEASGAIEKYFKQLGGNPIPNYLAREFLSVDAEDVDDLELILDEDGIHYSRPIGVDRELITKMLFGFKNREVYEKVMDSISDYTKFKNQVNQQSKTVFTEEDKFDRNKAAYVIRKIFEYHTEWGFNELLPDWHENLIWAKNTIEKFLKDHKSSNAVDMYSALLSRAKTCLDDMPVMKCHQLKLRDIDL